MYCAQVIVLKAMVPDLEASLVLRSLWKLRNVGITDALYNNSPSKPVKRDFVATVTKLNSRYEVAFPLKAHRQQAGGNLRKKPSINRGLLRKYGQAVQIYQNSGMTEKIENETIDIGAVKVLHYIPHQTVKRQISSSAKLRIVCDASSHSTNSKHLNDNLESDPHLNSDLVALLLNFQTHPLALVADVDEAKRPFCRSERRQNRDTLQFLWYTEPPRPNEPFQRLRHDE